MTPPDMDRAFGDGSLFTRSAWRLELLPEYDDPVTRENIRLWRAGKTQGEDIRVYWDAVIRDAREAGKTITRVHVVDEMTEYLAFEFDFYRGSVEAGEDIRILPTSLTPGLDLPTFDFWLLDSEEPHARVAVQYYGLRGAWLRAEIVTEPGFVADCCRWRDAAMSRAIPLDAYQAGRSAA
jgi:hypothetical protein